MFRLLKSEKVPVTRELALFFASLDEVPQERTLKDVRLRRLEAVIVRGELLPFVWAYAHLDGRRIRVNGKHSSHLFLNTKLKIPDHAVAEIQEYGCEDMQDVVSLWSMFDSKTSVRTDVEKLYTYAAVNTSLEGLPKSFLPCVRSALAIEANKGTVDNVTSDDQKNVLLGQNADFAHWYYQVYKSDIPLFKRAGVAYGALRTYRCDSDDATVFWREVVTGSNPDIRSGSRVFQNYLMTHHNHSTAIRANRNLRVAWDNMAATAVFCWNHWRKSKQIGQLRDGKRSGGLPTNFATIPEAI